MARLEEIEDIEDVGALVAAGDMLGTQTASNQVQFYAITGENPSLSNSELQKKIEELAGDINGEVTVNMSNMDMSALGSSGVNIRIKGRDLDKLQELAKDVKKLVENTEGTQNVSEFMKENTEQLLIRIR